MPKNIKFSFIIIQNEKDRMIKTPQNIKKEKLEDEISKKKKRLSKKSH